MGIKFTARYTYTSAYASGAQGTVYFCKDNNLERRVAIKVFDGIGDEGGLEKEIQARQKIQSKHVVQVFDFWFDDDHGPMLVMEMIEGEELSKYKHSQSKVAELLLIIYQIACGITDIHSAGLIHRDIKPHNMKRGDDGIVKIFDLGLTCANKTSSAVTTNMAGTRGFAGPEYYLHKSVRLTSAADVYAYGASIWYLLVGKLPAALMEIPPLSKTTTPSFSTRLPSVHPDVIAVLDRCLESVPADRPTMLEVRSVMELELTKDKHRGVVVLSGGVYISDAAKRVLKLSSGFGDLSVRYDGIKFVVQIATGEVRINNIPAIVGMELHDSCVICFGNPDHGKYREFLPFNVSKPEVVL